MEGPLGTFFYHNNPACEEIVLLATGTGIAPIKAILNQWQQQPEQVKSKKIWLLWGGRKKEDLFWQPETTLPNFTYIPVLSREDQWQGAKGYVQEVALQQPIHWQKAQVYACGSEVMIQSAQTILSEQGLKEENFFADAFIAGNK